MKPFSKSLFSERHRQLYALVRGNWFKLLLAMLFMLLMAGANSAIPFMIKPVVDDIFISKNVAMLKVVPLAVILIYLVLGGAMYGQEYFLGWVGHDVIRQLRNNLYDKIQDLPFSFFQSEKTGTLMSRITNDVSVIKDMVSTAITGAIRDLFTIIGLTGVIFYRDWKSAIAALVVLPLAFYPIVWLGRRVRRVTTGTQEIRAELNAFLHETFAGNKIVKAFGMESHEKRRFFDKTRKLFRLEMKAVKVKALSSPLMEFLGGVGVAFVIWYGGSKVIAGTSTPGTFFSFMGAVLMLYGPVKKLSKLNNTIQQGLAGVDRVFEILEQTSDIRDPARPVAIPAGAHRITFNDVYFHYDAKPVLKAITLDVGPGDILALVGMSGGGKTSLVNLIPRFYDVTQGAILIDGIDIRAVAVSDLRRQIAIVTQDPILFNDTVRNNIAYGKPDATDAEIEAATRAAYAWDFIQKFPEGFSTNIGELGGRLSGGQKQRICIARALLKNAPILILDEATSSLDSESEALVQKALGNLMRGRTTFVIAHRLSTIGYAQRVVAIVDGQITEQGTHEELLAARGVYHKLYQMQFNGDDAA
jgi:subfamily B ATP-binding cassette protein MsbA